ncbi:diamine acetyltransferase 1-like [Hippocampus comes]|uniref:diamine acetyltransferase 1-like n=1 Tax=Hippocampus comes TaxID=109280 RepID=UPI00094E5F2F|nr:PREDICTED: diamine acetyltransferase 1-like [Hippocampus comes]
MNFAIRLATKADFKDIWRLLRDLATHLKMLDQMIQTYEEVQHHGFKQNPCFECFVAVVPDEHKSKEGFTTVGCALYFDMYDTWKGQSVYLDHFYVMPEFRGFGIGKALLSNVAKVAKEKEGAWLQLNVVDWNTPSLDFFAARGAQDITVKEGWHVIHFDGQNLDRLANETRQN